VGLHASVEDICRFAASQFGGNGTVLGERSKKEAQRTQSVVTSGRHMGIEFGLGFRLQTKLGRRLAGHDGHLLGHLSAMFFDPEARLAVGVAANAQDAPSVQIVNGIFDTLDWFARNVAASATPELTRFSARLRGDTGSIDVIAAADHLAAIDPDRWDPFAASDTLMPIDTHTLRVTTSGNFDQIGELVTYTFDKGVVRAVRYAGLTMLPESGYVGRALDDVAPNDIDAPLTLDDLQHASLRLGRIRKVESCRGCLRYRLLVDFGPQFAVRFCYLSNLPTAVPRQALIGKQVLGAVFAVWNFGKITHEVLALGLALDHRASARLTSSKLLILMPDPAYPRTVTARTADRLTAPFSQQSKRSFFKIEALPDYPVEEIGSSGESWQAWRNGNYHHSRALLEKVQEPNSATIPNSLRILLTDDPLTAYQHWSIEFKKRVNIPNGERPYLLPRKYLRNIELPGGDFSIWDGKRVTVNGYTNLHWTHTSIYDRDEGNDIAAFFGLRDQIIDRAREHGIMLMARQ
jgi:Family of unknown function (DUF6879)/Beta-lactamase